MTTLIQCYNDLFALNCSNYGQLQSFFPKCKICEQPGHIAIKCPKLPRMVQHKVQFDVLSTSGNKNDVPVQLVE